MTHPTLNGSDFFLSNELFDDVREAKPFGSALEFRQDAYVFTYGRPDSFSAPTSRETFCNSTDSAYSPGKKATPLLSKQSIHTAIERNRRKDMKRLFSELRSLLPVENLRGKRSLSDQLFEAANYIDFLQQKMKDLNKETERYKIKLQNTQGVSSKPVQFWREVKNLPLQEPKGGLPLVKISSFDWGFEVSMYAFQNQIVYSDVLHVLEKGGVEVVSATSSTFNEKVLHIIHVKVADPNILNIDVLSKKLCHLIREENM